MIRFDNTFAGVRFPILFLNAPNNSVVFTDFGSSEPNAAGLKCRSQVIGHGSQVTNKENDSN